jgi:hypothetical protein
MALVPNHLSAYLILNPGQTLTSQEQEILETLSLYHLTFVEQFFIDTLNPTLNSEKLANASSYNLGATGVVRSEEFREGVSLAHLGRVYNETTINLHRNNMLGTTMNDATRTKMSESAGGVTTYIMDIATSQVSQYDTKSAAAQVLGISLRTLTR